MGMFDGVLGGLVGGEMASVINSLIEKHGGVQGIVAQLQSQGLGQAVKSWVGTGPNQPISPQQVHTAFGADTIKQLASQSNLTPQDLTQKLSQLLPKAIDHLTPNGTVPGTVPGG